MLYICKASIAMMVYPTTLDVISTTYLDSGFCDALGEHCPEILELIVTSGLPLLADQSIAADVEQVLHNFKQYTTQVLPPHSKSDFEWRGIPSIMKSAIHI